MKTLHQFYFSVLAVAGLAATAGCSSSPTTSSSMNPTDGPATHFADIWFKPDTSPGASGLQEFLALETKEVGRPVWISPQDSMAIIELKNGTPWPAKTVLAGLDQDHQVTAVLVATGFSRHQFQGFTVLTGQLGENDTVVNPAGDDATAMTDDIKSYLGEHTASNPSESTDKSANVSTQPATQPTAAL
jgi:hypothetical protein